MSDKTDELRDIFREVTGEETVTESQSEDRGSLADIDEESIEERLRAVIERMRDRYDFRTDLDDDALVRIVRAVYDGDDDSTIAADLGVDADAVFEARMDLHLVTDGDTEVPFSLADIRSRLDDEVDVDPDALAGDLDADADADTVERAIRVARTQQAIRAASQRFQSEFEDILPETVLSISLTEAVKEDGLDEAAEDIETDTQF